MDEAIKQKFAAYPDDARQALLVIRQMVFDVAALHDLEIEETFKWGQLSYLSKIGSTLRMDWSAKKPDEYRLYFNCKSRLVEVFKEIYGDVFNYEGNRAIVFKIGQKIPHAQINGCLRMVLKYHQLKQLPLLGE